MRQGLTRCVCLPAAAVALRRTRLASRSGNTSAPCWRSTPDSAPSRGTRRPGQARPGQRHDLQHTTLWGSGGRGRERDERERRRGGPRGDRLKEMRGFASRQCAYVGTKCGPRQCFLYVSCRANCTDNTVSRISYPIPLSLSQLSPFVSLSIHLSILYPSISLFLPMYPVLFSIPRFICSNLGSCLCLMYEYFDISSHIHTIYVSLCLSTCIYTSICCCLFISSLRSPLL